MSFTPATLAVVTSINAVDRRGPFVAGIYRPTASNGATFSPITVPGRISLRHSLSSISASLTSVMLVIAVQIASLSCSPRLEMHLSTYSSATETDDSSTPSKRLVASTIALMIGCHGGSCGSVKLALAYIGCLSIAPALPNGCIPE